MLLKGFKAKKFQKTVILRAFKNFNFLQIDSIQAKLPNLLNLFSTLLLVMAMQFLSSTIFAFFHKRDQVHSPAPQASSS